MINGFVKNNIPVHTQRLIDHKQKHWIDNDKQELHFLKTKTAILIYNL